jgi:two-component system phosphate regulon response regulator PhoB
MSLPRILVVDDESEIRDCLVSVLESQEFSVRALESGNELVSSVESFAPHLIILDYSLPGKSGVELIKVLRHNRNYCTIPIIMLTGLDDENEKVEALELGADDYILKPFSSKELGARVRAVLRRAQTESGIDRLEDGELKIDLQAYKVAAKGKEIYLTLTEFRILTELIKQKGKVLTRDRLRETALGNLNVTDRTIDVHMASLRKKLSEISPVIETVRGVGYRYSTFEADGAKS